MDKICSKLVLLMMVVALQLSLTAQESQAGTDAEIFIAGSDGGYWYRADSLGNDMALVEKFQDGPLDGGANAVDAGYFDTDNSIDVIIAEEKPADGYRAPNRWYKSKDGIIEAYYSPSSTVYEVAKIGAYAGKSRLFAGEFFNNGKTQLMTSLYWNGTAGCYQLEGGDDIATSLGDKIWSVKAGCSVQVGSSTGLFVCKSNNFELYMPNTTNDGVSFKNRQTLPTGTNGVDITAGDFDGDSEVDVFIALDNGTVVWYEMGSAYWSAPLAVQVGSAFGANVTSVELCDVNSDGTSELMVASGSGSSTITWYNPDQSGNPVSVGTTSLSFEVRDMSAIVSKDVFDPIGTPSYDPAGVSDVFSLSPNGNLYWYQGFTNSDQLSWAGTIADDVLDFAYGDLDNDGLTDIVYSTKTTTKTLHRCEYDSTTNSFAFKNVYPFGTGGPKVFIGNLYGGDRDNLFVLLTNGQTYWYKADDADAIDMQPVQADPLTWSATESIAVGYYDKYSLSTDPDIIVARSTGLQWYEYANPIYTVGSAWWPSLSGIQSMCMGDFDGNDETDLLYVNTQVIDSNSIDGVLSWSESDGYNFPPTWTDRVRWEENFISVGMGDIDGDGKSEVAAVKSDYTTSFFTYMRDPWVDGEGNTRGKKMGIKNFGQMDSSSVKILIKSAPVPCSNALSVADMNIDCQVNIIDYSDIADFWNASCYYDETEVQGERIDADLDYDCTVGISDLSIFVGQWLN
ncbi:MAG: FG-GAP repeat domain-containing protein [Sedimentisphaeraceae bacterium JB056]